MATHQRIRAQAHGDPPRDLGCMVTHHGTRDYLVTRLGLAAAATERGRFYLGILALKLEIGQGFRALPFGPIKVKMRGPQVKSATARWKSKPPSDPADSRSHRETYAETGSRQSSPLEAKATARARWKPRPPGDPRGSQGHREAHAGSQSHRETSNPPPRAADEGFADPRRPPEAHTRPDSPVTSPIPAFRYTGTAAVTVLAALPSPSPPTAHYRPPNRDAAPAARSTDRLPSVTKRASPLTDRPLAGPLFRPADRSSPCRAPGPLVFGTPAATRFPTHDPPSSRVRESSQPPPTFSASPRSAGAPSITRSIPSGT